MSSVARVNSIAEVEETGARQFASLLGELCLRAMGISLMIAGVIAIFLVLAGGTTWASTP
jgi:hypothetical protein